MVYSILYAQYMPIYYKMSKSGNKKTFLYYFHSFLQLKVSCNIWWVYLKTFDSQHLSIYQIELVHMFINEPEWTLGFTILNEQFKFVLSYLMTLFKTKAQTFKCSFVRGRSIRMQKIVPWSLMETHSHL